MNEDEKIHDIAVAMIRRSSMEPETWHFTLVAELHPRLHGRLPLDAGELPLVSAFLSPRSWYAFTTRRIVSCLDGDTGTLLPSQGISAEFGKNFKGIGDTPTQIATISGASGSTLRFEYETGKASMAPIYASRYWIRKHPILHKLHSDRRAVLGNANGVQSSSPGLVDSGGLPWVATPNDQP